ncbi:DUF3087 family protein [Aidingimonas halophila]|uniref:DUF3087 domain-containing protein n=1 Tax=Aidingimonas halophila TaxID=574349 RepID=A0A1H2VGK2_9GAMM|nr:DUF3087 family protein [Aidingimonas halophila]GHC24282.1 hypothetical protein GCM10008094_14120 [Aidingimonas halophila]SDW67467.1 Protein of unknown function [Aidingimonas halophila]
MATIFRFESHDPDRYRRKARIISLSMSAQVIVLAVVFSQLLSLGLDGGLWRYLTGILLALLATSLIFAILLERPWMAEMRYAWELRQRLSQVRGYLPTLRQAIEENNPTALEVLAFYHQGLEQLAALNGRTLDDDTERQAEKAVVRQRREAHGMPPTVDGFDPEDLRAFKKS